MPYHFKTARWAGVKNLICLLVCLAFIGPASIAAAKEKKVAVNEKRVRAPAVAGRFYSDNPKNLRRDVEFFLKNAKKTGAPENVRGLVAPHAGFPYSGIVAGASYSALAKNTKKVIIIGPSHRLRYNGVSIPDVDAYQTPLGLVPVAKEAAILRNQPGFVSIPEAHQWEHAIEVQLPFLQVVLQDFEFIPILVGHMDPQRLADKLLPLVKRGFVVVASSDLSHYHPYKRANRLDEICCTAIPALDFENMKNCEACGWTPIVTLMKIAKARKWTGTLLDYKNSGDTAGTKDKVVGYTAIAFAKEKGGIKMSSNTPQKDQRTLLELARSVIASKLTDAKIVRPQNPSPFLLEKRGCFVTLHDENGHLRGCIGSIEPVQALVDGVEANAFNAAFRDPRFPPLKAEELDKVKIEVSVLTVPRQIKFTDGNDLKTKLKPGVHGVILSKGSRRSTFLPQVWDQLSQPESFLIQLCRKAGMSPNCWQDTETKVEVYEAEYFSE